LHSSLFPCEHIAADANHKVKCVDWGSEQAEGFECTLIPMATMTRIAAAVDKRTNKEKRDAERAAAEHCKSEFKAVSGASKANDSKRPMIYNALQMTCCKHNTGLGFSRLPRGEEHAYLFATDLETKSRIGHVKLECKDISCRTEKSYERMTTQMTELNDCWKRDVFEDDEERNDAAVLAPYWGFGYRAIASRPCDMFSDHCLETTMASEQCIDEFHLHCHQASCWYKYGVYECARKHPYNERGEPSVGSNKPGIQCEVAWINALSLR
jgi:hypothetical protein